MSVFLLFFYLKETLKGDTTQVFINLFYEILVHCVLALLCKCWLSVSSKGRKTAVYQSLHFYTLCILWMSSDFKSSHGINFVCTLRKQIPKKKTLFSWQLLNAIHECLWQIIKIISLEKFHRSHLTERGEEINLTCIS